MNPHLTNISLIHVHRATMGIPRFFIFLNFYVRIRSIWKFPGQELNPSCATAVAMPDSLTQCARPGSNLRLCRDLSHYSRILNPLCHSGNSYSPHFKDGGVKAQLSYFPRVTQLYEAVPEVPTGSE